MWAACLLLMSLLAGAARADVQVGPAVPKARGTPGIYPVYELGGQWILLERGPGALRPGGTVVVVGSKAADLFTVAKATRTWSAACANRRPARTPGWMLSGRGMERVGTPIIAIKVAPGARLDARSARFSRLENQVGEQTYHAHASALLDAEAGELTSGEFKVPADDAFGQEIARDPKHDKLQIKIDFGSPLRIAGHRKAYFLVDGVQVSKTYRRCLRLFLEDRLIGGCALMPHALMAETNSLEFVAYDPSGTGRPFILAYTTREPLWGHERWGFRVTGQGPQRFMLDTLDPRCRDRF